MERMIEFRNHHFVILNEIVDGGNGHQRLFTFLGERLMGNLKTYGTANNT